MSSPEWTNNLTASEYTYEAPVIWLNGVSIFPEKIIGSYVPTITGIAAVGSSVSVSLIDGCGFSFIRCPGGLTFISGRFNLAFTLGAVAPGGAVNITITLPLGGTCHTTDILTPLSSTVIAYPVSTNWRSYSGETTIIANLTTPPGTGASSASAEYYISILIP